MKIVPTVIAISILLMSSGCWLTGSKTSPQGGIVPMNQEFSISAPGSNSIKQGGSKSVDVTLNRGPYFKQNVTMIVQANGITVTPAKVLIRASDLPETKLLITVPREAAIGMYRVTIDGTPESGRATSTVLIVEVTAQ